MADNEITFKDIILILIKYYYIIVIFLVIALLSCFLYINNLKDVTVVSKTLYKSTIDQLIVLNRINKRIRELNEGISKDYFKQTQRGIISLNEFELRGRQFILDSMKNKIETPLEKEIFLTDDYVFLHFFQSMKSSDVFEEAKKNIKLYNPEFTQNEINKLPEPNTRILTTHYFGKGGFAERTIQVDLMDVSNEKLGNLLIDNMYRESNKRFIKKIIEIFELVSLNYNQDLSQEIENIKFNNEEIYRNYNSYIKTKILVLEEQISIARSLGLEDPISNLNNANLEVAHSTIQEFLQSTETYMLGYKILESQLAVIKNRMNIQLFVPEYLINQTYISALQKDDKINSFKEFLERSRIKIFESEHLDQQYYFISIDDDISVKKISRDKIVLFTIFISLSLLLSFILIFILHFSRSQKN